MSHRVLPRTVLLLALLAALLPFAASAQTKKLLFDAGHAQMAGNADWVVDEDTCGSPQRFPTPAQSGITASTPETYWSGGFSAFGVDCAKAGYQIETLPPGVAITYGTTAAQDLANYNVFIIPEPNVRFTSAEKTAILAFVQHGGGLLMIADHSGSDRNNDGWDSPMIFNDLGSDTLFGIHFGVAADANNNIVDHPEHNYTADPNSFIVRTGPAGALSSTKGLGIFNGTTFTLSTSVNANAKGHIWMTAGTADTSTGVTFATSTYGSGRVAASGDTSTAEDATNSCSHTTYLGWNDPSYENSKVFLNAIAWLAAGGTSCTDTTAPTATITAPTATSVSGSVTISATGSDNVGVTGMTLSIDGAQVASSTTSAIAYTWNTAGLTAGSSHSITATSRDACGNTSATASKTVTIATTVTYSLSGSAGTSGAAVTAGGLSATSDTSNNYTIAGLANGTYTVTPTKSGCTFSPTSLSVTISGANATGKNFTASCTTGDTQLTSGVTISGESVAKSAWKYYYITVPSGATNLTLATTNATGDVDIYTQSGAKPTLSSYVCRPYTSGSGNESCSATNPAAGTWWLGVYGYAAGTYSVTGTVTTPTATYSISGSAGTASASVIAGTKTATSDASNNYSIAGLAAGTYTVTPSKSGCTFTPASTSVTITSANVTGINFTASCVIVEPILLDGFESAGWSTAQVSGTAGAFTLVASGTHPSASPHAGTKLADFNSYTSASGSQTRLYHTAPLSLTSAPTSATLTFWMYHDTGYSTSADKVQVQVSTNGTTWTNVGTAVNRYTGATGWAQATIDLSAYKGQGTVYLGFLGVSAYGNDVYLDDVLVTGN